jgi:hypothetical protein
MKLKRFEWLLVAGLLTASGMLAAQERPEISTDRPDQSNTPLLIPQGSIQIETGFIREDQSNSITNYTFNTTLIKFGVNDNFEFRLNAGYLGQRTLAANETQSGFGPMSVGLKVRLSDEKSGWPQAALITHVNFTTSGNAFNDAHTTGDVTLSFSHNVSEKLSLCYNTGIKWNGDTASTFVLTGSFAYSITSKLGTFAELYSEFPENQAANHNADGGLTFKINPVFQLDASAGFSFSSRSSFLSTGMAIRLFK